MTMKRLPMVAAAALLVTAFGTVAALAQGNQPRHRRPRLNRRPCPTTA